MASTRASTPAPTTQENPNPVSSQDEVEFMFWQTLRGLIQQNPLQPQSFPTVPSDTLAAVIPHIQAAHQAGLLTATSQVGVVTSFTLHTIPNATTQSISFCQLAYYEQGFQYGMRERFAALRPNPVNQPAPERTPIAPKLNPPSPLWGNA